MSANLRRAYLEWAIIERADLRNADLNKANLERTDLRNADLNKANLERTDLRGANFRGTDLSDSLMIQPIYQELTTPKKHKGSKTDQGTTQPSS